MKMNQKPKKIRRGRRNKHEKEQDEDEEDEAKKSASTSRGLRGSPNPINNWPVRSRQAMRECLMSYNYYVYSHDFAIFGAVVTRKNL